MAGDTPKRRHKTEPPPLTLQEIRFCQRWVEHGSGPRAIEEAGFSNASQNARYNHAFRLLRKPKIREYIRVLQQAAADAAHVTTTIIAQGLARTAFADRRKLYDPKTGRLLDPHEWPDDVAATVESIDTDEIHDSDGQVVGYSKKVRTAKRTEAQKVLAQWLRMIGGDAVPTDAAKPGVTEIHVHPDEPTEGAADGEPPG